MTSPRNGDTPPHRDALPPAADPDNVADVAAEERFIALMRGLEALKRHVALVDTVATRTDAALLGMSPVLGRVDAELETLIGEHAALREVLKHQAQAIVDLRECVTAVARSVEALAVETRGGFEALRAVIAQLAARVGGAESKAEETGRHFAPLVRAASASIVDGVEARRVQRHSAWRIAVGVTLAIVGAVVTLIARQCAGGAVS